MSNFFLRSLAASLAFLALSVTAAPHKVRITDRKVAESLVSNGGRVLADYGGFQIVETERLPDTKMLAGRAQIADERDSIELDAKRLNTRAPDIRALRKAAGAFAGRRLHLVQFVGPIKAEWRSALEKTGARIVCYVPQNAYLIRADAATLARVQAWAAGDPTVQWDGEYAADFKIHPRARSTDEKGNSRSIGTELFAVQMVADADGNADTMRLIDRLKLAPIRKTSDVLNYRNVIVALPPDQLTLLAAQPDVVSIHPYFTPKKHDERQDQIMAGNISSNAATGSGYLDWLASKGFAQTQFEGPESFIVDVSDSGIDNGTTTPAHFAFYRLADISQSSRIVYSRLEGTPNRNSTLSGCDGHGNLNAHIIGGYSAFTGFPHSDAGGFAYGLGVCPYVRLGSSVVFDPVNFTDPNYSTLITHAYDNGARISNNSWGSDAAGDYTVDAQEYDKLVRDAGEGAGRREMVIVFVAGNAGPNGNTPHGIDSPGTAKNVITVGASENVRSMTIANGGNRASGVDGCSTFDRDADSANDVADFSSEGPCDDGRIKPDLVAPGTHITGGAPQSGSANTNGTGAGLSCFNGEGVCALSGGGAIGRAENFFPLGQQFYTASSGTSHAAPAVSGACALLRQYFINNELTPPSPAMTKAFLMNSARYLTGTYANDSLPSPSQGMGGVNLGTAFDGVARSLRDQLASDVLTNSGQMRVFTGLITDSSRPFRVTLAWTDAAGSTAAARALVNDLDLIVKIGGRTYHGNVFNGSNSVTGGAADSLNNVESVSLPAGETGPFVVTVAAANIAADAITLGASAPQQDFALVVYNASLVPAPVIEVNDYEIISESCSPANAAIDPGETVTVTFTVQNSGTSDALNLTITLLETNGVVAPSGPQSIGTVVSEGGSATVSFTFTAIGDCGGPIKPTFILTDGSTDLGVASVEIHLGSLMTIYPQNFDRFPTPALPPFWTTAKSGGQGAWTVANAASDTAPNAAFSAESLTAGVNALISPSFPLPLGSGQLAFEHSYNIENGYDGGVLEIKIGTNAFMDILDAGGTFVTGGYDRKLNGSANPLAGRKAWTGDSGGFVSTIADLPATAAGQTIQFRWRFGTDKDNSTSVTGWWIDSVQLKAYSCCGDKTPAVPFTPSSATYSGLFFETDSVRVASSGYFSASVNNRGGYSGTLLSGKTRSSFSGSFDVFGAASNRIVRSKSAPLTLLMQMDTTDNRRITGAVSDASWTTALDAERSQWDAKTNPTPYAGTYTLIFPGAGNSADNSRPQGDGYALVSVSAAGVVSLTRGTLADSQATFTQSAPVSQDGLWPLYGSLYGGKGQILGWLTFANGSPNVSGEINWTKLTNAGSAFYRGGFTVQTNAIGSAFHSPAKGVPILNFGSAKVAFAGGNYFEALNVTATNPATSRLLYKGTNGVSITLNSPQPGLFKGTVQNPLTKKPLNFSGVILQTQQVASGFWLGTNQSGKVIVTQ